jgi:hypothetical protein
MLKPPEGEADHFYPFAMPRLRILGFICLETFALTEFNKTFWGFQPL